MAPLAVPPTGTAASEDITEQTLKTAEESLKEILARKRDVERQLQALDAQIYNFETSYLEDSVYGNVIKGYEGYLTNRAGPNAGLAAQLERKRPAVRDEDRIFSSASTSWKSVGNDFADVHYLGAYLLKQNRNLQIDKADAGTKK